MTMLEKSIKMNQMARKHQESGNDLLAKWLLESSQKLANLDKRTNRVLDRMALGNYQESMVSRSGEFTSQWFRLEEEYAFNFSMD